MAREDDVLLSVVGSFLGHCAILATLAFAPPVLGDTTTDVTIPEHAVYLLTPHDVGAEPDGAPLAAPPADGIWVDESGGMGLSDDGSLGDRAAEPAARRHQVRGPEDNADPHLARHEGAAVPCCWPALGAMGSSGDDATNHALSGRDDALGVDPGSARGHPRAFQIGDARGGEGLGYHDITTERGPGSGASPRDAAPGGCHLP
jgi:hypothetical protein